MHWLPYRIPDGVYFFILVVIAIVWLGVAIAGLVKFGWAGCLLLIPAKWGLLPFYLAGAIYWSCAVHGACP